MRDAVTLTLVTVLARGAHFLLFLGVGNRFGVSGTTDTVFFLYAPLVVIASIAAGVSDVVVMPALHRAEQMACVGRLRSTFVRWASIMAPTASVVVLGLLWPWSNRPDLLTVVLLGMAPAVSAVSSVYMGVLNAAARYRAAVLGPLCGALVGFLGLLLLPITTAGLAGVLLLFEIGRFSWLRARVPRPTSSEATDSEGVQRLIKWAGRNGQMQVVASLLMSLNPLVDMLYARSLSTGSVTSVEYASRLWNVVPLFFSGYLTLIYAQMSRRAANKRVPWAFVGRRAVLVGGSGLIVSLAAIALAAPAVNWVYGFGAMSVSDRQTLARLLSCYLIGAAPYVASLVYVRAFSVRGRADILAWVACANVVMNVVLDALLIRWIGVSGIGLATAGSYALSLVLFVWVAASVAN